MDLDGLLKKHGLPVWGSDELKKERAQRNGLLAWDLPKPEEAPEANDKGRSDIHVPPTAKELQFTPKRGRPAKVK